MANKTKAERAAELQAAGIPQKAFTIPQFCARHAISEGLYQKLRDQDPPLTPRETRLLDRVIITEEAETDWRREREAASVRRQVAAE
ncbi:hypothetical protein JQ633_06690 [Bradyrhizobium tropiciagri]|uniref:hypothetical protein n=1 Tax=Bradyrhizobium tropiciagri TaxID=312253 RepID=UPI001BA68C18|nr:hypothetical protein [Bradyrhizobium tropiciagri]MBR0870037.1 hypothetical protein [Bradyrhizobium tropiciagri]